MSAIPNVEGGFRVVCADPPWHFKSNSAAIPGKNAMRHYGCMGLSDLVALPVKDAVASDAWLFLWITGPFLAIGAHMPIVKAWGFKTSTIGFVWEKENFGTGYTTRSSCEFVVVGRRGSPKRASASVRQFIREAAREHSRKPDEFYRRVETLCEGERLELFGRQSRPGWTVWGNEAAKFDGAAA